MSTPQVRLVDTRAELPSALEELDGLDPVAVDVERADGDRYWRSAALIQVGGNGRVVLVDPLGIDDLAGLDEFLSARVVVLHAMENDLVPLAAAGVDPPEVEDTAIAAALLGLPTGLTSLHEQLLGVELANDKEAMQRADWEARPLTDDMLRYAADDVARLPELWELLRARLVDAGRWEWYREERDAERAQPSVEARRSWRRLKGLGRLDPMARGRARALWEERERLARTSDTAPSRIVADKALVELAKDPPRSPRELGRRGVRRQSARRFGDELLAALGGAEAQPPERRAERRATDDDRAAAERLRVIRAEVADELDLDAGVLCPSRTLLGGVLADPADGEELRAALGLRPWQWRLLGPRFCEELGLPNAGTVREQDRADPDRLDDTRDDGDARPAGSERREERADGGEAG